ncbi:MAG TPA: hypothetical protein VFJ27_03795 [Terriglobia bacterium]|nr:hypothetical protein [Terriglobia bacterium]
MRLSNYRRIVLLVTLSVLGNTMIPRSQVSVAGRWECTGTGLEAETISFRLELTQSGSAVSGVWIIGNDEIPIREGKAQDNRIELITFADDKQFTTVAMIEGNELKGTWKDDTGRSGTWQGKRQSAAPK